MVMINFGSVLNHPVAPMWLCDNSKIGMAVGKVVEAVVMFVVLETPAILNRGSSSSNSSSCDIKSKTRPC